MSYPITLLPHVTRISKHGDGYSDEVPVMKSHHLFPKHPIQFNCGVEWGRRDSVMVALHAWLVICHISSRNTLQ